MSRTLSLFTSALLFTLGCGAPVEPPSVPAATAAKTPSKPAASVPKAEKTAAAPTTPASPGLPELTFARPMIPMRDGPKLETLIITPKNAKKPLPFLLIRSPYGVPPDEAVLAHRDGASPLLADGYIFVLQNLRGRFKSEGQWVMDKPPRDKSDPRSTDESTDAYDTIEWLLHNVPNNNGRAGMIGTSYAGWTATMALLDPHPALKAVVEGASPADQFLGDDFHHNGAFRLAYGFEYAALLETEKESNAKFKFDRADIYEWYLALGPLSNANDRYFHGKVPTWNDFVEHPTYDAFWKKQAFVTHLTKTTVPLLNVGGWWDQEDFYGPLKVYELFEKNDAERRNHLVVGPWNHGGWGAKSGQKLGPLDFGSEISRNYRTSIEAPWLAYFLHDKGALKQPEATVFETGTNRWRTFDKWPPEAGVTKKKLYLRADRALSFDAPKETGEGASDTYVSDPASPVPFHPRPIAPLFQAEQWPVWMLQDQRFVDGRPDVLSFSTGALDSDVTVAGDLVAEIFAATSGSDSDWIVKLIDVYPEGAPPPDPKPPAEGKPADEKAEAPTDMRGYQLIIACEVLRGRFRESFERPAAIPSNKVLKYTIDLHTNSHVFQKGHRIMVQVQSSWFPLIDRNPQRYVENIYKAAAGDYVKATQRIARSREAPSAIILPILPN